MAPSVSDVISIWIDHRAAAASSAAVGPGSLPATVEAGRRHRCLRENNDAEAFEVFRRHDHRPEGNFKLANR